MKLGKVAQSCPTLCDPMDCIIHGILQVRILEWVTFNFSRGSSQRRNQTQVSHIAKHKKYFMFSCWSSVDSQFGCGFVFARMPGGALRSSWISCSPAPMPLSLQDPAGGAASGATVAEWQRDGSAGKAPWCSGLVFTSDAFHFPTLARASPCPHIHVQWGRSG